MGRFLIIRLVQAVMALVLLSMLVFVLSRIIGNPLDIMLPPDSPPEVKARLTESMGLNKPLYIQYLTYMKQLMRGDLGKSVRSRETVTESLRARLPASLSLAAVAMVFTVVMAFPLGMLAAVKRGTPLETIAKILALSGQSLPAFWVGILLIHLFSLKLDWLPPSGSGGPTHYIMPAFTMSLFVVAGVSRLLRTGLLEVLDSEFVRFARSKGVSERSIFWKHALRNSLVPVLGFAGVYLSIFVTMAVVVEVVFAWPGVGRLAFNAIFLRDYPLIQGVVLLTGVIVIAVNFVVDLLYAVVDPRIRYGGA
ncbi:MAG: ABC transporter permease [candidate division NC10 bacterium]|jgi:peptide/nickel transport system permease protein